MSATARRLSVVSAKSCARRRLIRSVRPSNDVLRLTPMGSALPSNQSSSSPVCPSRLGRWTGILFAIGLVMLWCWFSLVMSSIALDYPLRRAGESAFYPASGTPAFFIGCAKALFLVLVHTSFVWVIPFAIALSLIFWGLGVKRFRPRALIGLSILILPIIVSSGFRIHHHLLWVESVGGDPFAPKQ